MWIYLKIFMVWRLLSPLGICLSSSAVSMLRRHLDTWIPGKDTHRKRLDDTGPNFWRIILAQDLWNIKRRFFLSAGLADMFFFLFSTTFR